MENFKNIIKLAEIESKTDYELERKKILEEYMSKSL